MSRRNILIMALIVVIVIIVGAVAYWTGGQVTNTNNTPVKDTKLAFYNNGPTWLQAIAVIPNATVKNGTQQNFYMKYYLKPQNGTVTLDLSNMTGYGGQPLPAGTTIRVLTWQGLFNSTVTGSTASLNYTIRGWSNTADPQSNDIVYTKTLPNLPVNQLPTNLTDNNLTVTSDITQFNLWTTEITGGQKPVYEEYLVNVDANGRVTIVEVQPPTLCNIMAHII